VAEALIPETPVDAALRQSAQVVLSGWDMFEANLHYWFLTRCVK
jgi:hypothetical protein